MRYRKLVAGEEVFATRRYSLKPVFRIDRAAWIWHPCKKKDEPAFLLFRKKIKINEKSLLKLQITADQHFILMVNKKRLTRGPDRSDPEHWSFNDFELELEAGSYTFEVLVWWLGDHAPLSLMTCQGGFILKAAAPFDRELTTGKADWEV